jgi:hypothetical protein
MDITDAIDHLSKDTLNKLHNDGGNGNLIRMLATIDDLREKFPQLVFNIIKISLGSMNIMITFKIPVDPENEECEYLFTNSDTYMRRRLRFTSNTNCYVENPILVKTKVTYQEFLKYLENEIEYSLQ